MQILEPESPEDALVILRQIQLLRAPGKVLLAHLIRDLRRVGAVELLGYNSVARMVEDLLKLSERSARNRVAESLMFESNAAIEEAFATGRISTMQAYLIRQLKHTEEIEEFVERARETTWRQFQREYRMLTLMRKCTWGGTPCGRSRRATSRKRSSRRSGGIGRRSRRRCSCGASRRCRRMGRGTRPRTRS